MKKSHAVQEFSAPLPFGGFVGIFIAAIAIFFVLPLFATSFYAHLGLQLCFTFIVLSTISAVGTRRRIYYVGLILIIPFLFFDAVSIVKNSLYWMVVAYSFYCVFLFWAILFISKKVLTNHYINTNLIFGAITIYLFSGILWGKLYFLIDVVNPGSFHSLQTLSILKDGLGSAFQNQFDLLYYSFTTLSTLGIGDIAPVGRLVKSLTILEAMFGQLFTATVIAKMVSVWRENR